MDQGITSVASVDADRIQVLGSAGSLFRCKLGAWQHAATAHLLALPSAMRALPAPLRISPADAAMLAAMVAGDRSYLSHSLRAGFERTGSFHMLVVSGFHLAIVAGCIFFLARRLRVPQVPATLLTIATSFAYAMFTGFATPVQRSLWMVTLYLLAGLFYRQRNPLNTIGFAALCLLAISPRSLFDAGLQMTLLAVIAIAGVAAPLLETRVRPYLKATRDLRLRAIDAGVAPRIAQFRVTLRMVADSVQTLARAFLLPAGDDDLIHPMRRRIPTYGWRAVPLLARSVLRCVELIAVACAVELAMTLPMALYFHRITLFALPVNLLILPLLALLMPAALLTLAATFIHPAIAVLPAMAAAVILHVGVSIVDLFGSLTFGDFRIPGPTLIQCFAFCGLVAAAMVMARGNRWQRRTACCAMMLAALTAVAPRPIAHPRNTLLVEAIDVGQGDSLLLITPDGKTLLVDAGGFGGGPHQAPQEFDIGEEVVSSALWARGIRHLDVVALTHAHSDHMGGMPAVLRNFKPDELWVGNNPHVAAYSALLAEADTLHVTVRSLSAGDTVTFGAAHIAVLAPLRGYQPDPEPTNNDSLVMHASYGATSVLLEGDAEAPIEQAMLNQAGASDALHSTLLKVGHHGSLTSTRPEFLAGVAPQWAVISCGLHNRYHHPRPEVLEELQAAHVRTYATDLSGAVCFSLDGKTVTADAACGWQTSP